jgi:hypothetical protein
VGVNADILFAYAITHRGFSQQNSRGWWGPQRRPMDVTARSKVIQIDEIFSCLKIKNTLHIFRGAGSSLQLSNPAKTVSPKRVMHAGDTVIRQRSLYNYFPNIADYDPEAPVTYNTISQVSFIHSDLKSNLYDRPVSSNFKSN